MPNPPASAIVLAAFFALVALPGAAIPLADGDVWWHIRAGQEVLATGSVPERDTWSIVASGERWVSQDWLSNVVLALGYEAGEIGLTLLSILFSLLVVAALALLYRAAAWRAAAWPAPRADGEPRIGWLSRVVAIFAGLVVAAPVIGVRVQVVDLLLAAIALTLLWGYLTDGRLRWLVGLPLLAAAWANLHAGWVMLFLLGGAVLVGEAAGRRWRSAASLAVAGIVSLGAISLNPNGQALYLYPFETAAIGAHRDFLAEWSPPDLASPIGQLFAAFVLLGVVPALIWGRRRMRLADALILIGLTAMAVTAARFLLFAPLAAIIVAISLGPAISTSRVGRAVAPSFARLSLPRHNRRLGTAHLAVTTVVIAIGLAVTYARVSPATQRDIIADHMPVTAVSWILANDPGSRPFNTYAWGGYLGLRRPDTLIFIDGRSDIYGDVPIRLYAETVQLERDPQQTLDRYEIDHVLFNTQTDFASWLDASPDWQGVYTDPLASVWIRR